MRKAIHCNKEKAENIKGKMYPFFFFLFSLFIFIFFGCRSPLETPKPDTPPAGTGNLLLTIDGLDIGRTILPATTQSDFAVYSLDFYAAGTTANPAFSADRTNANFSTPVNISAGTWDLRVTAYMDTDKTKPAAQGSLAGIKVASGQTQNRSVTLTAIISDGEGSYRWNIDYPTNVVQAGMTITPLDTDSGTPEQALYFIGGTPAAGKQGSLTLNSGYYRVVFLLLDDKSQSVERREILHVYQNLESAFDFTFTAGQFTYLVVTSGADSGPGTLRQAISDAPDYSTITIDESVGTIALASGLSINKNLTIEGNSVTITRGASWVVGSSSLLTLGSNADVTIRRTWFRDGKSIGTGASGAAINISGIASLESCIFSANQSYDGGALYTNGNVTISGCTFYGNSAIDQGGTIYNSKTLILTGNLFYGNTAIVYYPVVAPGGTQVSYGLNAVDAPMGTDTDQSGWNANPADVTISGLPVSPASFKLLPASGAAHIITTLPESYPAVDFYGNAISSPAAAGAVQTILSNPGYYLDVTENDKSRGSVTVSPQPDADGFVSGSVTLTANSTPGYQWGYWLVNGVNKGSTNPLYLTLTDHTSVEAVFTRVFTVDNFSDSAGSETAPGTLRYALANVLDGDTVSMSGVTPGITSITLTSQLLINRSITIEGNGVIMAQDAAGSSPFTLLGIPTGEISATISRVWFRGGRATEAIAYSVGGAIFNNGILTLQSCIFSGNQGRSTGGAVYNGGGATMTINGCSFYGNSADRGGAIGKNNNSTLDLEGNLFYGNTAATYPVVDNTFGTVSSNGYNVVDASLGTGITQSGWTTKTGDATIGTLPVSPVTFRLLPGSGAANAIGVLPAAYPSVDFYGNAINAPAAAGAVQAPETLATLSAYLTAVPGGNTVDNPVPLFAAFNGGLGIMTQASSGWQQLLGIIANAGKYAALDLSACGMEADGIFDPDYTVATGKDRIVSLVLPDAAGSIVDGSSSSTFRSFSNLKSVSGTNIISIGVYAFLNCSKLSNENFPAVINIGGGAFAYTNLQQVTFPAATNIGGTAFADCFNLIQASFPVATNITACFIGCSNLNAVSFPATATVTGDSFSYCQSLTSFILTGSGDLSTVENGMALIRYVVNGIELISYPSAIGNIEMNSITDIGLDAFSGCNNLSSISFPMVTSINDGAFDGCTSLSSVIIPLATSIGNCAFSNTGTQDITIILGASTPTLGLKKFISSPDGVFANVTTRNVTVQIPQGATGYSPFTDTGVATVSGDDASVNWANGLRGMGWDGTGFVSGGTLQQGITVNFSYIPFNSPSDVSAYLASAPGGDSVDDPVPVKVGIDLGTMTAANSGWQQLLGVIANAGKYVALDLSECGMEADGVFDPDGTVTTGKNLIVSLVLPDAAGSISDYIVVGNFGYNAFENFGNLRSVSGSNLTTIGELAFSHCTSLSSVNFPMAQNLGQSVFTGCTSLSSVNFPMAQSIEDGAFSFCTSLIAASFPATTSFNRNAFYGCSTLTSFILTGSGNLSVTEGGRALVLNIAGGKELVSYPSAAGSIEMNDITSIGDRSFYWCTSLGSVSFPAATSIGFDAFNQCNSLNVMNIPTATSINVDAICNTGTQDFTITLGPNVPTLALGSSPPVVFSDVTRTVTVRIPQGATGYSPFTDTGVAAVSGADSSVNWANGLRGMGWDGSGFSPNGTLEQGITVKFEYETN